MALITIDKVSLAFGHHQLLDAVNFSIERGERIALVGRNGAGKTTLMRLLVQEINADDGQIHYQDGIKIAILDQEVPEQLNGSVFDIVASGAGEVQQILSDYHHLLLQINDSPDDAQLTLMSELQQKLDHHNGWNMMQQVEEVISRLNLQPGQLIENLSGGLKRRVMLAKALVNSPDILLLDEPTNHLDLDSIIWLENFLSSFPGTLLFISHDRTFMQQVANRFMELDRGNLYSWEGDYHNYLRRKAEQLHAEQKAHDAFDKKLSEEEVWIRQGIKARRTRNEGRVRALKSMRNERRERRQQLGQVKMEIDDSLRSGKIVAEIKNLGYAYANHPVVRDFSGLILRGDRIGVMGPNGIGKSTLLRLILGELTPQEGQVKLGTKLEIAWFDQLRGQLDGEKTVLDNIGLGKEFVTINGKERHVYSYLQDFLFSPERARAKVKALSGGERNRLLLARLFTSPANLLVLDEPTNDLDADTLELLESLLLDYSGTLILVSHDRSFLNNVVTSTLVFEPDLQRPGEYVLNEYAGGYDDWLQQRPVMQKTISEGSQQKVKTPPPRPQRREPEMTSREKRELQALPEKIEQLEQQQAVLEEQMAAADFYQQTPAQIDQQVAEYERLKAALEDLYQRWEMLESLSSE